MQAKVRLVGNGGDLHGRVLSLKAQGFPRQVLQIRPSSEGELFLLLPDETHLGYLPERMKRTFKLLLKSSGFKIEADSDLNMITDVLRRAKTVSEATIRVNIHVYGPETLSEKVGKQLSKGKLFLQHPTSSRPGIRYNNPHILRFDDMEDSSTEECIDGDQNESEIELSSECDEEFEETIANVFKSLRRCDNLCRLKMPGNMAGTLYQ